MISLKPDDRPSCEDLMRHPKVCFVVRYLRLREMEQNVKRKDQDIKVR
jgi:hypothetical protein